jgi:tagatose-1,6-bisphosphate aldolase non-catalytic subunit AgaZ/GatZ
MTRNTKEETEACCHQLLRYGGVLGETLVDLLDVIVDINDDMHHGRDELLVGNTERAKQLLDQLLKEETTYSKQYMDMLAAREVQS